MAAAAAAAPLPPNTYFVSVIGSGLPEVDGLYIPSTAEPKKSESGTMSSLGYWNGKLAWDRADGLSARNPALSYSNSYKSWRLCRLDGHLAYDNTCDDALPPSGCGWGVYKKGKAPAPKVTVHTSDPRLAPNVVFVLGGPGAGKGTMCELAANQLGWSHLSAGDLLRAERATGGENAALINDFIARGAIVPVEITVALIKAAMEQIITKGGDNNFLVDGFPRSLDNWAGWQGIFGGGAEAMPTMLFFECPLPVLEARILKRAKYSGRKDDNIESLRKRFATYKGATMPTVDVFRAAGKVVDVDSSKPRTEVWALVKQALSAWSTTDTELTERSKCLLGMIPWPKREKKKAKPELFYFDGPGRANLTRLCFVAGGTAFTDTRVADWPAMKADATSTPGQLFGSMPCINQGGVLIAQSLATAAFAAEVGGLMGSTPEERAVNTMVAATNEDLRGVMYKCLFGSDDSKAAGRVALPEAASKFLAGLERALGRKKSEGAFFGAALGLADLAVFDNVCSPFPGLKALAVDLAAYPKVLACAAAVGEDEKVKAFVAGGWK